MKTKRRIFLLLLLPLIVSCTPLSSQSESSSSEAIASSSASENLSSESEEPASSSSLEEIVNYPGTYKKIAHAIDGFDTISQFVYSLLQVNEDMTAILEDVDFYGKTSQSGDYVETATGISVTIGLKTYDFKYERATKTLTYKGRINRRDVIMSYVREDIVPPTTSGEVAFNEEFFGESLEENFYNYAPTIMMEGNDVMHIWYCSNKDSGNITDYIGYRRGELKADGKWIFSAKKLVLEPTPETWDARHTCDPSVIKGDFVYNNEHYPYLMAYLGCVTNDSSRNEVGIAIAKAPEGPWIKMNHLNPIANYYTSPEYVDDFATWGYGQPSLISVDKAGEILLFYSKGLATGTFQAVEHWDLSNLNSPVKIKAANVSNAGVVNANGGSDVINNADFAYDSFNKRIYVIKEDFPYTATVDPKWITTANTILYIDLLAETSVGDSLFLTQPLRWQRVGSVGPNETGMERVHNAGLLTDEYGWLLNPYQIPVVYTKSDLSSSYPDWELRGQWPALHTYRLHGYLLEL